MIANIDPFKSAATSLVSVIAGTFSNVCFFTPSPLEVINTVFQHAAWIVAIVAGLVSIVNGTKTWRILNRKKQQQLRKIHKT